VLSLLREARSHQLQIYDRDDPDIKAGDQLIHARAMLQALRALSTIRLEDTLYAEFNHMRPWIERLRGRYIDYAPAELAKALGLDVNSDNYVNVIADFKYSGFMRESPNKRLSIPILYRASLGIQEGRPSNPKKAQLPSGASKSDGRGESRKGGYRDSHSAAKKVTGRAKQELISVDQKYEGEVDRVSQSIIALGEPYLPADEYRTFFEILADEANKGQRPMGELARSVRDRFVGKGFVLRRHALDRLLYSYSYLRRRSPGDSYHAEDFATIYFERIVRLLRLSYVDLTQEEREALARRIVGRTVEKV
jgi:hypothetical protein